MSKPQNKMAYYVGRTEDTERAGNLMDQHLTLQARMRSLHPETTVVLFLSRKCPHCIRIMPLLAEFQNRHPEVFLETRYADESDVNTRMLEVAEGGETEVPAALVNDRFLVRKSKNFLLRLTYAISLAKNMPTMEDEEFWKYRT